MRLVVFGLWGFGSRVQGFGVWGFDVQGIRVKSVVVFQV